MLAMNDDSMGLIERSTSIASKLGSHSFVCVLVQA